RPADASLRISMLAQSIDNELESRPLSADDIERQLQLFGPVEAQLRDTAEQPSISLESPGGKVVYLLWAKSHASGDEILDRAIRWLQDDNVATQLVALDAVSAQLRREPAQINRTSRSRLREALDALRTSNSSPFIREHASDLIELLYASRVAPSEPRAAQANPYIAGLPVRPSQGFFGRKDVIAEIKSAFLANVKSIILYGARRTGKTSLLYSIQDGVLGDTFVPIYIDVQGLSTGTIRD